MTKNIKNPYPTAIEIMKIPVSHKKEVLKFMAKWKEQHRLNHHSTQAICDMVFGLTGKIYKKPVSIVFSAKKSYYSLGTIYLSNLSIVTALHETAHHLYGKSERMACRWSIWLFKKIFPDEFSKLQFQGHLLVKNPRIINLDNPLICLPNSQPPRLPLLLRSAPGAKPLSRL